MASEDSAPGTANNNSQELDALLRELKKTPAGLVIFDQIIRLLEDWRQTQSRIEAMYTSLLSVFLDVNGQRLTESPIPEAVSKLIETRMFTSLHGSRFLEQLTRTINEVRNGNGKPGSESRFDAGLQELLKVRLNQLLGKMDRQQPPAATEPLAEPADDRRRSPPPQEPGAYPAVERRVNSAYRLHLDRKHDEIEKLQEMLTQKASEAIIQNKEFGALLEIERSALQQASSIEEIEDLKEILIGGTEELIKGQRQLAEKLRSTMEYLRLVKSDSERLHNELNKVRLLSLTDEFTGLPNRRAFTRRLEDEMSRAQRHNTPLALAIIDLDEFKQINDAHGHAAGDEVLRWYASQVLSVFRHHDMVARYGGEEFAVLLPNTGKEAAMHAINKVRTRVANAEVEIGNLSMPAPTFSTGLTMYKRGETARQLIERADKALYRAKQLGRNRIEVELAATEPDPAVDNSHSK